MTFRADMLAAMRGKPVNKIPWAPRMDLWYIANRARETLPEHLQASNMVQLAQRMGVACHAVRADFTNLRTPEHNKFRGFGLDLHDDYPFSIEIDGLPVEFKHDQENFYTTIKTPAGEVTTHTHLSGEMLSNGISLPFIKSYPIKSRDDLEAVAQVFEHMVVIPKPEAYARFKNRVGEQGVAIAAGLYAASPIHLILHDLMNMEQFFMAYMEDRKGLLDLARRMAPFFTAVLDAVMLCDAEVVYWGSNYDHNITWPPFFRDELAPWLKKVSRQVHAGGKQLLTHTDGENKALLPLYPACEFDIAESVCPHPMTLCSLKEIRQGLGKKIAVWGGIPSIALMESAMDADQFASYLDHLFEDLGTGQGMIFGVSDAVPPDAELSRFEKIRSRIDAFGPVGPEDYQPNN